MRLYGTLQANSLSLSDKKNSILENKTKQKTKTTTTKTNQTQQQQKTAPNELGAMGPL